MICNTPAPSSSAARTGRLKEGSLLEVLGNLVAERRTGVLHLTQGREHLSFRLVNGHVVSGSSGVRNRIGDILGRCGLLGQSELALALAKAQAEGRRLGPVLVELGFVSREGLEEALRLQVRDALFTGLAWDDAAWELTLDDAPTPLPEDAALWLSTPRLLREAVDQVGNGEIVRRALGDLDAPLATVAHPLLPLEGTTLGPADGYVLSRVDGSMTARQILEIAPLPAEAVARSLFALLTAGVIERRPRRDRAPVKRPDATKAPAVEPVREQAAVAAPRGPVVSPDQRRQIEQAFEGLAVKNCFEVLGVPRTANPDEVKAAYHALARRFHPDALGDAASAELEEKARAIFVQVTEAFRILRGSSSRARYEEKLDRATRPRAGAGLSTPPASTPAVAPAPPAPVAPSAAAPEEPLVPLADLLRTAEEHLAGGRLWEASLAFEELLQRSRGPLRQRAHLLLARTFAKSPSGSKRAETQLKALLLEDPGCVDGYMALAQLYRDKGVGARAAAMYRQALSLDPGHARAAQELSTLAPAPRRGLADPRALLERLVARPR
jgi:curved DNA-binding protein CbpA